MATLQKFKFLATQCAVVGSPTRSPTTSPVIHIRRRKTLRMLLGRDTARNTTVSHRRFHQRRDDESDRRQNASANAKRPPDSSKQQLGVRLKLKDLFVSSPPPQPPAKTTTKSAISEKQDARRLLPPKPTDAGTSPGGAIRPLSATLRQRLLMRRAWRPMLMAIPEQSP